MTNDRAELLERVRALLADEPDVAMPREIGMFGGVSVMVHEKMIVSVMKGGELLVRVPAEWHEELLERPGAEQAEMGAGRTMGPGWIVVSPSAVGTDEALSFWLGASLEHNRAARARP